MADIKALTETRAEVHRFGPINFCLVCDPCRSRSLSFVTICLFGLWWIADPLTRVCPGNVCVFPEITLQITAFGFSIFRELFTLYKSRTSIQDIICFSVHFLSCERFLLCEKQMMSLKRAPNFFLLFDSESDALWVHPSLTYLMARFCRGPAARANWKLFRG